MQEPIPTIWESKHQWIEQFIDLGFPLMSLIPGTKTPFLTDWSNVVADPTQSPQQFPDNYGVIIPHTIMVIDLDPKSYDEGDDAWLRCCKDLGLVDEDLDTFTVRSRHYKNGLEGLHIYFQIPEGIRIRKNNKRYKGVQALSKGSFVVGPGSQHPDTQKPYVVVRGCPGSIKNAPIQLIDLFQRETMDHDVGLITYVDDEQTRTRYIGFLLQRDPAVEGCNGDDWTYKTAAKGKDLGLPPEVTYQLMSEIWNPQCSPPWDEKELMEKVVHAYEYTFDEIGNAHPSAVFEEVPQTEKPLTTKAVSDETQRRLDERRAWHIAEIIWDVKGNWNKNSLDRPELKNTVINVVNFFEIPHYGYFYSLFYDPVRFNRFSRKIEFTRPMPWHVEKVTEWRDVDRDQFSVWLSSNWRWNPDDKLIDKAVRDYAHRHSYHPVLEWFGSLEWDGISRIDSLFPYYCGADDNDYTREIGRRFMIAMVRRILEPGCKHDHIVILEGDQGIGKSSFCQILGGKWYTSYHLDPHHRSAVDNMLGKMLIELAEMTYNRKAEVESIKAFLSQTEDRHRELWDKHPQDVPRQCVFVATTNERAMYLRDVTGNRRAWPVFTTDFKLNELKTDRNQLFAEAIAAYKAGEHHWIIDPAIQNYAKEEQAKRFEVDSWVDCIMTWLEQEEQQGRLYERLSTIDIASEILNLSRHQVDRTVTTRIHNSMTTMGWVKTRVSQDKKSRQGYKNPNYMDELDDIVRSI